MKAFTFLGLRKYENTTYIKHDGSDNCESDLFPFAVAKLYIPDKIIAFITPKVKEVKKEDLTKLSDELGDKFTTVDIPDGNSTDELWDIFTKCVDADVVEENDEILLDITHAFRSIPLLIFIVAAYLRQVKNVKLKHIIYGAFEARNQDTNQTPIFDLTPFVELLDWMNAVNVFQNSGDARLIAGLDVPPKIANALTGLSDALLTNRTFEAQKAAFTFNGLTFDSPQAPPFRMLVEQLKQSYQRMAVNEPSDNQKNSLKAQYQQIKWYVENQHYLHAITLMREWLISWKCLDGQGYWLSHTNREAAENALNTRAKQESNPLAAGLAPLATDQTAIKLWNQCKDIRNDLTHCGMRNNPKPKRATDAIQGIQELFKDFEEFVQKNTDP
jgi:CRISPR-associated DxTHG motif protein